MLAGEEGSGSAVIGVGLGEDVGDMDIDGRRGEEEGIGDLSVALASGDEAEDLDLARREARGELRRWRGFGSERRGESIGTGKRGLRAERGADRPCLLDERGGGG